MIRPLLCLMISYYPPTALPLVHLLKSKLITASVPYIFRSLYHPPQVFYDLFCHFIQVSVPLLPLQRDLAKAPHLKQTSPSPTLSFITCFLGLSLFHNTKNYLKFLLFIHFSLVVSHLSEDNLLSFFFSIDLSTLREPYSHV